MLRRIFGPKKDDLSVGYRKLNDEERHNLCHSPNIFRFIKSSRMRWAADTADEIAYKFALRKQRRTRSLGRRRYNMEADINPLKPSGNSMYHLL
jgi:hypothetical protein